MSSEDEQVWQELRAQRDILVELRTLTKTFVTTKDDHEVRLRRLEERKFPLPTVAVLIALSSLAVAVLTYMARH